MLLGCNYSKELIQLLETERAHVDYIKLGLYPIYEDAYDISCPSVLYFYMG